MMEILSGLKKQNYELDDRQDMEVILKLMLDNIGHSNPDIRDELIYPILANWVYEKDYLSNERVSQLFDQLLDENFLFYKIDQEDDQAIYRRSFSSLALTPILHRHEREACLSDQQMSSFRHAMIDYIGREHDFTGYDKERGWAHALAHWSDASIFLTQGIEDKSAIRATCLQAIQETYLRVSELFTREEDERLCNNLVYEYIEEGDLSLKEFKDWLSGFEKVLAGEKTIIQASRRLNIKNLMRSLYFRLVFIQADETFLQETLQLENKMNNFLYD